MIWQPYQLYSLIFGQLHEELVSVPDQFQGDMVFAHSFNRSLAIAENVDVPIPIFPT
jgi:hypothetical protein